MKTAQASQSNAFDRSAGSQNAAASKSGRCQVSLLDPRGDVHDKLLGKNHEGFTVRRDHLDGTGFAAPRYPIPVPHAHDLPAEQFIRNLVSRALGALRLFESEKLLRNVHRCKSKGMP